MQYLMLIYSDHAADDARPASEQEAEFGQYMTFTQEVTASGHFKGGEALQPLSTARTVSVREGETFVVDGPFAETKEQLGGFYICECETMEEACAIAARIPTAKHGRIEVRPVLKF